MLTNDADILTMRNKFTAEFLGPNGYQVASGGLEGVFLFIVFLFCHFWPPMP